MDERELVDKLFRTEGRAEVVGGAVIRLPYFGARPGSAVNEVRASLHAYTRRTTVGLAVGSSSAFRVGLPRRLTISAAAAYWAGPRPPPYGECFAGAPQFAAEVRVWEDYEDPSADRRFADRRADYFAAGTLVVWDVDLLGADVVRVYRASDPLNPTVYRRGQTAEAEPAVPGWTMPVDDLFEP